MYTFRGCESHDFCICHSTEHSRPSHMKKKRTIFFFEGQRRRKESRKRRYRFPTVVKEVGVGRNNTCKQYWRQNHLSPKSFHLVLRRLSPKYLHSLHKTVVSRLECHWNHYNKRWSSLWSTWKDPWGSGRIVSVSDCVIDQIPEVVVLDVLESWHCVFIHLFVLK